jgi:hypothetical protein
MPPTNKYLKIIRVHEVNNNNDPIVLASMSHTINKIQMHCGISNYFIDYNKDKQVFKHVHLPWLDNFK